MTNCNDDYDDDDGTHKKLRTKRSQVALLTFHSVANVSSNKSPPEQSAAQNKTENESSVNFSL